MDQLRFTGLHEDGAHLVVTGTDGTDFMVAADERLRAALRQSAGPSGPRTIAATPREIQTHIRAGYSAEEVAESSGWTVERVRRYEGPILAERAHVARLGSACVVRTHDRSGPAPTLQARVRDRLHARGVNTDHVTWDSKRPDGGQWSVQVQFMAGQRVRHASWSFDVAARSVEAIDDEARWLSEDEQTLPASAPAAAVFGSGMDGPDDLISSMRERSRRRGQAGGRRRKGAAPVSETDGSGASPIQGDQELPLEDLLAAETDIEAGQPSAEAGGDLENVADHADVAVNDSALGVSQGIDGAENADEVFAADELDEDEVTDQKHRVDRDHSDSDSNDEGDVDEQDDHEVDGHTTLDDFFGISDEEDNDEEDDVDNDVDADDSADHGLNSDASDADRDVAEQDHAGQNAAGEDDSHKGGAGKAGSPSTKEKASPSSRARKGRPSVPSWDDIMFGARDRKT